MKNNKFIKPKLLSMAMATALSITSLVTLQAEDEVVSTAENVVTVVGIRGTF